MNCPHCYSKKTIKHGTDTLNNGIKVQNYKCKNCKKRFNERTGTPMSKIHNLPGKVALAMKIRSEGNGLRATARILSKSHATIIGWEKKLADMEQNWSPSAPARDDVTIEGDELYTRVKKTFPPATQKDGRG